MTPGEITNETWNMVFKQTYKYISAGIDSTAWKAVGKNISDTTNDQILVAIISQVESEV